jgi:hypothetical protein
MGETGGYKCESTAATEVSAISKGAGMAQCTGGRDASSSVNTTENGSGLLLCRLSLTERQIY